MSREVVCCSHVFLVSSGCLIRLYIRKREISFGRPASFQIWCCFVVCSASDDVAWVALLADPVVDYIDYNAGVVRLGVKDTKIYILHRCVLCGVEDHFESADAP
jgi:hypothetical protein